MTTSDIALLVLEDGTVFMGRAWGARGRTRGGMTGYQETLTDPSYHRQIVVMTAPHIGNTGVNDEDPESSRIWVAGFVVRDAARRASNWRSRRELEDELISQGIVGIADVDTRAITRHIRERGAMRAESPAMSGQALAAEVSTDETYVVEPLGDFEGKEPIARVVAVDLGIKSRTPYHLAARGVRVYVVPSTVSFADIEALKPDGVFFSNGPGDPSTADREIGVLRAVLDAGIPYFGICFGHQLFGRALGYGTYKLDYGHRGINQPVKDVATGRVEITAHNHGFAVDAPVGEPSIAPFESGRYGRVEVSHVGLNDGVVEGLRALDIPAFSVQYHPEAAAGPHDGELLFDRFISLMAAAKETH